jgi:ornithine cyclodeaminase/alanine dehydrogenase-like protein (mu-crystallin family)
MAVTILGKSDLQRALPVSAVIERLRSAFEAHAAGTLAMPPRQRLAVPGGVVLTMACAGLGGRLGIKTVSVFEGNPSRGLPRLLASYALHDAGTGALQALMDGTHLTAVRTAATSALAATYLARPEAARVGVFGTGVQARFHLEGLRARFPITEAMVVGRTAERAAAFAKAAERELGLRVRAAARVEDLLAEADIVVTATTAGSPLFPGRLLRPGQCVLAVGAFAPTTREVDSEAVRRARVYVDTWEGALAEAGDLLIPLQEGAIEKAHLLGELGDLVTGRQPGRRSPEEITLFKSVGSALEDLAAGILALEAATANGLGRRVEW